MKIWIAVLALVLSVSLVGVAQAKDKAGKALRGKITKVDGDKVTVMAKGTETVVATDASTAVTIDGEAKKVADLHEGLFASVTPAEGTATTITATTTKPERKAGAKKPAADDANKPADSTKPADATK